MEPETEAPPQSPSSLAHVERKAVALLILVTTLVCSFLLYVMYARGVFESTQQLVLIADDSEGVIVGMDVTFSGFPIGRVRRIELSAEGNARMVIDIPKEDAHWLRTSSVFTLERSLVGETRLRAFSGILTDPPLPENAQRVVLSGNTSAEMPRLVAATRELLENMIRMTGPASSLNSSLAHLDSVTERLGGRYGMLSGLLGGDDKAKKIIDALDHTTTLLAKADQRLFGANGFMDGTQAAVTQLTAMLTEARASLQKVDAVLKEAQAVGANARVASTDLGALRAEVEASLRKVNQLVDEVNRKWPLARDTELKLP